ncbi:MAG: SbcC/MukB-like Walker B domain-containing protein [Limnochordia bacterium]
MKPIYLSFAGLNSYKEEQHVDFTYLFGAGVFGIFGPTGSGKSTILDALTLALYGSVERASHRTQGILNQYSNQVSVAFTFELENAQAVRRFRVERTFKQGKTPGGVEGRQARLVEVACREDKPGREEVLHVLAENATNVTAYIETLLGLTLADFTRAVVLPQGKFAEFLTLQGSERRNMLQRLFGLELYGERLAKQLRHEHQENDSELKLLEAKQAEIGDASPAAVKQAEQLVADALRQQKEMTAEFTALEKEYAQWAQVWSLQGEMAEVKRRLAALNAQTEQMQTLAQSLILAQRAELVRPTLVAYQAAEKEVVDAQEVVEATKRRLTAAVDDLTAAQAERAQAERQWTQESPGLYGHQADLNRAVELEKQLALLQEQQQKARQELEQARQKREQVRQEARQAQAEAEEAEQQLGQVRKQILARAIDPEQRAQVTEAVAILKRWQEAQQQWQTERQEYETTMAAVRAAAEQEQEAGEAVRRAQNDLDELRTLRDEHTHAKPWDEDELDFQRKSHQDDERVVYQIKTLWPSLQQATQELTDLDAQLESCRIKRQEAEQAHEKARLELAQAKEALAQAVGALQDAQHADMAATLAKQVAPGRPCPVCGSLEHPQLAASIQEEQLQVLEQEAAAWRERVQNLENVLTAHVARCSQTQAEYDLAADRIESAQAVKVRWEKELAVLWRQLPKTWRELEAPALPRVVEQAEKDLQERERAYKNWLHKEQTLEKEERTLITACADAEKDLSRHTATLQAAQSHLEQSGKRVEKARQHAQELQQQLDQIRGDLAVDDIASTAAAYRKWDREVADLRTKEAQCEKRASAAKQRWEEGRIQLQQLDLTIAVHEKQTDTLRQQVAALQADISAVTGGRTSAADALAAVTKKLRRLDQSRTDAQGREQQARQKHQQALQDHTGAQERLSLAHQRAAETQNALTAALQEHGFISPTDVQAALRSPADREALQVKIQEYQDELKRWCQEENRLERLLAGRSMSQAEWEERQARLDTARARRDAALQAYAVAEQSYKELSERCERWQLLEKQAAALRSRKARLDELASLLRGNALVDFLAEQQLQQVAFDASAYLGKLTAYRYAVEVGSDGSFIIRDDANGGYRRAVHTLSGGETFLTSLALALALSSQIQLQGKYPLEFFFLDEGFGSLDQELLDVAMTALERLHLNRLHVGIISHVPELRNRILRRLIIEGAVPGERGSRIVTDVS